jgi:S-formylglutathione hydrolase FrmB
MFRDRQLPVLFTAVLIFGLSCRSGGIPVLSGKTLSGTVDRTFRSAALGRKVTYRVIFPAALKKGEPVHVLYLLHGNGGSHLEWAESSNIARLAPPNFVLVLPDGESSYFLNSATHPADRYEDFMTHDLIADAERGLPGPVDRTIAGNSMGGFAAITLALKHPDLYRFAGALSPPIDYAERRFTAARPVQSLAILSIFGPAGSVARRAGDPFVVARQTDPRRAPYIFLSAGDKEPLLGPIRSFEEVLTQRHIPHEFHIEHGEHNWQQWNRVLPELLTALQQPEPGKPQR